jgi:hypothetical protein
MCIDISPNPLQSSREDLEIAYKNVPPTTIDMFKQVIVNPDLARKRIVLATFGFTANVPMDDLIGNRALELDSESKCIFRNSVFN